jgi:hypothetical protein
MQLEPNLGSRVDASELALMWGITRQHLTRLCREDKVPSAYRTKGGHWRFRWSNELAAAINAKDFVPATRSREKFARTVGAAQRSARDAINLGTLCGVEAYRIDAVIKALQRRKKALKAARNALYFSPVVKSREQSASSEAPRP